MELNNPSSPLRSWYQFLTNLFSCSLKNTFRYLKKSSTQAMNRSSGIQKERPGIRQHRKALPEILEVASKDKVIKELIITEALYVDDLSIIIKVLH